VVALPFELALLVVAWRSLYPRWRAFRGGIAARIGLGVTGWAVLMPGVLAVHAGVLLVFAALDWQPTEHPLTQLGELSPFGQALFFAQTCLAAPLVEEILCRGLLLPWAIGARERNAGGPQTPPLVPPVIRPWLVLAFSALRVIESGRIGPAILLATLAAGLGVIWVTVRHGRRHVRGVYATAAFFALIHSNIWPTPIPLFALGLGLGWLAVRTRGVLAPAIVHGLFNAVSAVFVLRGGAG
jgi:membrane protease YdiL (CAAX protease family)